MEATTTTRPAATSVQTGPISVRTELVEVLTTEPPIRQTQDNPPSDRSDLDLGPALREHLKSMKLLT